MDRKTTRTTQPKKAAPPEVPQEVLTGAEIAAALKISKTTLRRWVDSGYFPPPVVLGSTAAAQVHRWPARALQEFRQREGL